MKRVASLHVLIVGVGVATSGAARAQAYAPYPPPQSALYPQPTLSPQQRAPQYSAPSAYGPQNGTAMRLQDAERSDSGRGLELAYAQASVGGGFVGLDTLSNRNLGLGKTSEGGPVFGLGGGLRLLFFTLGARARVTTLADFDFWQIDLEAGYHVPIGRWDPYVAVHGGYAFESNASEVAVHGGEAGVSGGLDHYVTPLVSVGVDATADLFFLARPKQTAGAAGTEASSSLVTSTSGSSVGLGLSASLHAGLHFGS